MSRDNKTTSSEAKAGGLRRPQATAVNPSGDIPATSALLTDCIMPGIQGESLAPLQRVSQDNCLLRDALRDVAAPLAIRVLDASTATASETMLRERTNDFMIALRRKADYLDEHSRRVGLLSAMLASDLGLPGEQVDDFEWVGALHDAGKLAISGEVLTKPGKLLPEEYEEIKAHPEYSEALVAPLARLMGCEWAPGAVRHHHERIDGGGYPDRLRGDEIPLEARVIAVCDAYDAMAGCRPYQDSLAESTIRENLRMAAGSHLDQSISAVFLGNLSYYRERIYTGA